MYIYIHIYIYIYIEREREGVSNHPGWRLMRLGYRTCFHTLYEEKKIYTYIERGCLFGVMVKTLDCRLVVSEFELHSLNYIPFQTASFGKVMNPFKRVKYLK